MSPALPGQIALEGQDIVLSDLNRHELAYVALHLGDGTNLFKRVGNWLPGSLSHLRQFETIGDLGVADVLAVDRPKPGFSTVERATLITGVFYEFS